MPKQSTVESKTSLAVYLSHGDRMLAEIDRTHEDAKATANRLEADGVAKASTLLKAVRSAALFKKERHRAELLKLDAAAAKDGKWPILPRYVHGLHYLDKAQAILEVLRRIPWAEQTPQEVLTQAREQFDIRNAASPSPVSFRSGRRGGRKIRTKPTALQLMQIKKAVADLAKHIAIWKVAGNWSIPEGASADELRRLAARVDDRRTELETLSSAIGDLQAALDRVRERLHTAARKAKKLPG
jgi:hypothetical protein